MKHAKPLPSYLVEQFQSWKTTTYAEKTEFFHELGKGQSPRAMVISCCDSRVHVTELFGAEQGEIFMHRNIANHVPPCSDDGGQHGTAAALEYGITALKVSHLVVVGHSACGGVQGCIDMCEGNAPGLEAKESFVGRWIDTIRPAWEQVSGIEDASEKARACEKAAVLLSLENLMSYPFVQERVASGELSLHGLWHDIGNGGLEAYNHASDAFEGL